jgi:flagellar basal-body rod protein FlgB
MDFSQTPLLVLLRDRMGYLSERQQVIAENVANADTPGFLPKDLKPFDAQMTAQDTATALRLTQPNHMQSPHAKSGGFPAVTSRDSETRLDGNSVVLEEQMMKLSDARMNYDAAIGLYQKSLGLLKLAAKAPGK